MHTIILIYIQPRKKKNKSCQLRKYACKIRWMCLSFDFSCNCWWNTMPTEDFMLIRQMKEIGNNNKSTCSLPINITGMHDNPSLIAMVQRFFFFLLTKNTMSCRNKAKRFITHIFFLFRPFLCSSPALFWDKKTDTHSIVNWSRAIHSIFFLLFLYFY